MQTTAPWFPDGDISWKSNCTYLHIKSIYNYSDINGFTRPLLFTYWNKTKQQSTLHNFSFCISVLFIPLAQHSGVALKFHLIHRIFLYFICGLHSILASDLRTPCSQSIYLHNDMSYSTSHNCPRRSRSYDPIPSSFIQFVTGLAYRLLDVPSFVELTSHTQRHYRYDLSKEAFLFLSFFKTPLWLSLNLLRKVSRNKERQGHDWEPELFGRKYPDNKCSDLSYRKLIFL